MEIADLFGRCRLACDQDEGGLVEDGEQTFHRGSNCTNP